MKQPVNAQSAQAIGSWDGVTTSASLADPYENPKQAMVPFGIISFYNQPWRSYLDIWKTSRYSDSVGVNWSADPKYAAPLAQLLKECGIRYARLEIGWSEIDFTDNINSNSQTRLSAILTAFKQNGIRPLILLNSNAGVPCPTRVVTVQVAQPAIKGAYTLKLSSWTGVRPGYTGIQNPAYIAAYPMITGVDADGTAHLSSSLPMNISAGSLDLIDLKYKPFQGTTYSNGTSIPEATDTYNGWMKYVAAVGNFVRQTLGTTGASDSGFDVEVWNELGWGSNFLDINNYYDTKFQFGSQYIYSKTRSTQGLKPGAQTQFSVSGWQSILPMTIDYFTNTPNGFKGVNVISGFSNQEPYTNGTTSWPGQAGYSRHYYTGDFRNCSPSTPLENSGTWATTNALGNLDGKLNNIDWATIVPGTSFIPTFCLSMPEYWYTGFKTEGVWRDLVPDDRMSYFNGNGAWQFQQHGRYTDNGDLRPAQVWMSESNYWRWPFFQPLISQYGYSWTDPRLLALDDWLGAKMILRETVIHAHKGLTRDNIFLFGLSNFDFGMYQASLLSAIDTAGGSVNDTVRSQMSLQMRVLQRITSHMASTTEPDVPRPLSVNNIVEYKPRLVFQGDGTTAHPSRYNRDEFAFLPFQASSNKYVIPYYVATLDVSHVWNTPASQTDPHQYDMPEQQFDVTIGNINGSGASVTAYDPMLDQSVPVTIVASTATSLTIRLNTVDYPRLLQVTEAQAGPQIIAPKLDVNTNGQLVVSFSTNMPVQAQVNYGQNWTGRHQNTISVTSSNYNYSVTLPALPNGVAAVGINVSANGLSDSWPKWDEDPAGQIVLPAPPTIPPPLTLTAKALSQTQISLSWTDNVQRDNYIIYRCTDGTIYSPTFMVSGSTYSFIDTTATPGTTYLYQVCAYTKNATPYPYTNKVMVTSLPAPGCTVGSGLKGQYYNDPSNGTQFNTLALTRIDPSLNYAWGLGSPDPSVHNSYFSAKWTGTVVPKYSETYTFYTYSDDGVRLWVNGQLLVNNWTPHGGTENSGIISLTAGVPYSIQVQYYQVGGNSTMKLSWSSVSQSKQIVPQSQLYPSP